MAFWLVLKLEISITLEDFWDIIFLHGEIFEFS
jgi:hypothetical protein